MAEPVQQADDDFTGSFGNVFEPNVGELSTHEYERDAMTGSEDDSTHMDNELVQNVEPMYQTFTMATNQPGCSTLMPQNFRGLLEVI